MKLFSFTLDDILHPVTISEFLTEYFGIAPLHVPGSAARFSHLSPPLDETSLQLTVLTQNLERILEAPVQSHVHQTRSEIDLHRTEQDKIVLQISGQDSWTIQGRDTQPSNENPRHVLLTEGDALYVPRGWWCAVTPQLQHRFSLMLHIHNPTGADLLVWLIERIKGHDTFQRDIPRFASPAVRAEYLTTMRKAVAQSFRLPSLLERYAYHLNAKAPARSVWGLPWNETLSEKSLIALATPRYPQIQQLDQDTILIKVAGKDYSFPLDAAQLLQYLIDKTPLPLADFYRNFTAEFDREELSEFLSVLSTSGIIAFFEPEPID